MTDLPILYSFRRCPYAIRARYALSYKEIKYYLREVDLKQKPQSMLDISPKGTVPVLQLADGSVIDESLDIISYAWEGNVRSSLIERNDNEFAPLLRKYKYHERYPEKSQHHYRSKIEADFLKDMNILLASQSYINGEKLYPDDIAIFPFIRQFALVDKLWFDNSEYNNIRKWLYGFLENTIFDFIMQKHSCWQEGDNELLFDCALYNKG